MTKRGYISKWIDKAGEGLEWESKGEVARRLQENRVKKKERICGSKDIVVVVPSGEAAGAWWSECRDTIGLDEWSMLNREEREYLRDVKVVRGSGMTLGTYVKREGLQRSRRDKEAVTGRAAR